MPAKPPAGLLLMDRAVWETRAIAVALALSPFRRR